MTPVQFRAIAQDIYGTQTLHGRVRKECIEQIEKMKTELEPFVCADGVTFEKYVHEMSRVDCWGGQVELQALSFLYK